LNSELEHRARLRQRSRPRKTPRLLASFVHRSRPARCSFLNNRLLLFIIFHPLSDTQRT
jgi:hypothetical protein